MIKIDRIEYLHGKNFIHRDVKPDNFLIGRGKNLSVINIIDFGLTKRYRDPKTHEHIQFSDKKSLTGTARYASLHSHLGYEQGRRDDLESIGYILVYLLKGSLPWQGMVLQQSDKYKKIKEVKSATPLHALCSDIPSEFQSYLQYCRDLKFDKEPDYQMLKSNFKKLFAANKFEDDGGSYDWNILNPYTTINNSNLGKVEIGYIYKLLNQHNKRKLIKDSEENNLCSSISRTNLGCANIINSKGEKIPIIMNTAIVTKPSCCTKGMLLIKDAQLYKMRILFNSYLEVILPHLMHSFYTNSWNV